MASLLATYGLFIAAGFALFVIGVLALVWLVRAGQLDDLETPALRMLHDDAPPPRSRQGRTAPDSAPAQESLHV